MRKMLTLFRQPPGECDSESDLPCSCPRRSFSELPEQLPIRDYFKDSAFNQCRRQPWPMTTGKPMRIHTKPETVPYCCKNPTLVPLNFWAQVKADIVANVMKGILERVPTENMTRGALGWQSKRRILERPGGLWTCPTSASMG